MNATEAAARAAAVAAMEGKGKCHHAPALSHKLILILILTHQPLYIQALRNLVQLVCALLAYHGMTSAR